MAKRSEKMDVETAENVTVKNSSAETSKFTTEIQEIVKKSYSDIVLDSNVKSINSRFLLYNQIIGGIPIGRFVVVQALEGVGKSSLVVQLAADIQKFQYPIVYLDTEYAMSTQRFSQLGFNLNDKNVIYLQPTSLQQVFSLIRDIIKTKIEKFGIDMPAFIIWDSIAATPAKEEVQLEEIVGVEVGIRARILSQGLRVITGLLSKSNVTLIAINQYRMKMSNGMPSWGGPQYTTPGGLAPKFTAYQTIELKDSSKFNDEDPEDNGKLVKFKALKNKMKAPLVEFSMYYTYEHGFDNEKSLFYHLKENKQIIASGPKYHLKTLPDVSFFKKEFSDMLKDQTFASEINKLITPEYV